MNKDLHARLLDLLGDEQLVQAVDLAYLEDGYFKPADVYGNKLMTGQEWYERFHHEIGNYPLANTVNPNNHAWICPDVMESARRAAGLDATNE